MDGINLEYVIKGHRGAEPIVFINGSVIASLNAPLIEQPILINRYYLISIIGEDLQKVANKLTAAEKNNVSTEQLK